MLDLERLKKAYLVAKENLLDERTADGHWVGELSTSALSTATAVSALSAVVQSGSDELLEKQGIHKSDLQLLVHRGVQWLSGNQNSDGGWGDTRKSYSNISTTLLAIASFHFANRQNELANEIKRAEEYVAGQGGIPGLRRRYGRDKTFAVPILANCAMAGTQPWKEVSTLPFEAACVPQKFYHLMQLPVVSYAIPALVSIGQAKFFHDPPWNPVTRVLRKLSVGRSLKVLSRMQPASGGFLEAIPLTSFVVMGLATTNRADHQVVLNGIRFIVNSVLKDGSWPIDTNLATWTSTLSVNALSAGISDGDVGSAEAEIIRSLASGIATENGDENFLSETNCLDWILSCQHRTVHPFTNSPPGGWGWTDLSGAVPDADDTPGALLALDRFYRLGQLDEQQKEKIRQAAEMGVSWLLKLQNRDRGWPTFCRGWGKLPFDRSGADITAHCLRGIHAWRNRIEVAGKKIDRAIAGGLQYLEKQQRKDGSWLPLWFGNQDQLEEENPVYGTAKVLAAYHDLDLIASPPARKGLAWLANCQNPDGSWGGGVSAGKLFGPYGLGKKGDSADDPTGEVGSIEETSLAVEALLFSKELSDYQAQLDAGLQWLIEAVEADCYRIDSPIGFYFAKLWYHERLYPQIFAVSALGRALARHLKER